MADIDKIKSLLETVQDLAPAGFAIAFHIRLTAPDFLFQSYPKEWIDLYSERGYVMVDPIVRWGFTETGNTRWSDLAHMDENSVLEQSHSFGMTYGVAIATETEGSRSVAGFARSDREFNDDEIATLTSYVEQLHAQTDSKSGMPATLRNQLHDLSIQMTRPVAP